MPGSKLFLHPRSHPQLLWPLRPIVQLVGFGLPLQQTSPSSFSQKLSAQERMLWYQGYPALRTALAGEVDSSEHLEAFRKTPLNSGSKRLQRRPEIAFSNTDQFRRR